MTSFRTGIPLLDLALGGGVKPGLLEIYGETNVGKTCFGLSILKAIPGTVAVVDLQHSIDPSYVVNYLGDKDCLYSSPNSGEAAFEVVNLLLENGVDCVFIDNIDGIIPLVDIAANVGAIDYSWRRRLLFHGLSAVQRTAKRLNKLVIITSQVRMFLQENPPVVKSSNSLITKRIASTILRLSKQSSESKLGSLYRSIISIFIEKDLHATPGQSVEAELMHPCGFSFERNLLDALIKTSAVIRSGTMWRGIDEFNAAVGEEVLLGPGRDLAIRRISRNAKKLEEVWRKLLLTLPPEERSPWIPKDSPEPPAMESTTLS